MIDPISCGHRTSDMTLRTRINLTKALARKISQHGWGVGGQSTDELPYAATVYIWLRWIFLGWIVVENSYRIEFGALSHFLNTAYTMGLMAPTAYVHWKMRVSGRADGRWLFALSAIDAAALAFTMSMSGGFESRYFVMYYVVVAMFAWIFTSPYLVLFWTTMLAAVYTVLSLTVGDGVDFGQQEEKELFYRLLALYAVAVSVGLITRFERVGRVAAARRERELNRQRIEISQTIHDTTAQSAYTLGLGLEDAIEMADDNPELVAKLEAMWEVSRSTMWALRHPIDAGAIFSGSTLGDVLADHAETFTTITSIPAKLVRHGDEPDLSAITRSLLFAIAHNALTNSLRHSGADSVTISLDFRSDGLRMSVSDDGTGLPEDYEERGYGFKNMRIDAERVGGVLQVESDDAGTTVSCTVPYESVPYEQNLGGSIDVIK